MLIALLVTDKVCRIVGLLLFVIATVTFVFGEPILETSTSIPPVCETMNASATPKPVIESKESDMLHILCKLAYQLMLGLLE